MRGLNPRDQIKLSADEMREMGYRISDMLVDYHGAQAQFPVTRALQPGNSQPRAASLQAVQPDQIC